MVLGVDEREKSLRPLECKVHLRISTSSVVKLELSVVVEEGERKPGEKSLQLRLKPLVELV